MCVPLCGYCVYYKCPKKRTATLSKRETPTLAFSCEYFEIFKNTYFEKTSVKGCFCYHTQDK